MSDFPTAPGDATAVYRALLDAICRIENRLDKIEKNKEVVNNIIDRLALEVERAADEIERLRAENARLRAALQPFAIRAERQQPHDTIEWRMRYQSDHDHVTARSLCLAGADEIARLNRLLDWCMPRLSKGHQARLDQYRINPRQPEPDDFLPIIRSQSVE